MRAINLLVFTVAGFLAGCTTDISHRAPFSSAVGKSFVTKRATLLYRNASWESSQEALNLEDNALIRSGDYRRRSQEAVVPAGQSIRINSVVQEFAEATVFYDALGEVFVPSLGRFVAFRYGWGFDGKIMRAPWENAATPRIRYLP
jgi:hypothetical protein